MMTVNASEVNQVVDRSGPQDPMKDARVCVKGQEAELTLDQESWVRYRGF